MHLQNNAFPAESWAHADICDAVHPPLRSAIIGHISNTYCIDAKLRMHHRSQVQVQGRKADGPASLVAMRDARLNLKRSTQDRCRTQRIAGTQAIAHAG